MELNTITCTPYDDSIKGRYKEETIVLINCDASDTAFTITLPDARQNKRTIFHLKKIDSTANKIIFQTVNNQTIDGY